MNPERWQELDSLLQSALQRVAGERAAFLDEACGGDDSLRKQVEALLAAHEAAASFIESPAFEAEARQLAIDEAEENTRPIVGQTLGHRTFVPKRARAKRNGSASTGALPGQRPTLKHAGLRAGLSMQGRRSYGAAT